MAKTKTDVSPIKPEHVPISFNGDCVDPFAKIVITEALDYAIETAHRRLVNAGKAVSSVESQGMPALQVVQGIREAIIKAATCPRSFTEEEKDTIALILTKEKAALPLKPPKKKAKPEKLTPESWNSMAIPDRVELAKKAGMEGKRGGMGYGSLTPEEIVSLEQVFVGEKKPAPKPPEPKPPKEEKPLLLIPIKAQDPKDPKKMVQAGWGVLDPKTHLQTGKINLEDGTRMLDEGKARLV